MPIWKYGNIEICYIIKRMFVNPADESREIRGVRLVNLCLETIDRLEYLNRRGNKKRNRVFAREEV